MRVVVYVYVGEGREGVFWVELDYRVIFKGKTFFKLFCLYGVVVFFLLSC